MILELARQAYNALKYNRRRSVLTMLGMAWGIATVVLLLAYGAGFESALWIAFRSWGTNLVFVFPGRTSLQAGGTKAGSEVKLTVNDLDYLQAEVPLLKRISPEAAKQSTVAYGIRSGSYGVSGVYPYYSAHAPHGRPGRHVLHRTRREHAQPRRRPRFRRQEEAFLRPERPRRKSPPRRHLPTRSSACSSTPFKMATTT